MPARVALLALLVALGGGLFRLSADPQPAHPGPLPDPGPAPEADTHPPEGTAAEFAAALAAYKAVGGDGIREAGIRSPVRPYHEFTVTPTAGRVAKLPDLPFEYRLILRITPDTAPGDVAALARLKHLRWVSLEGAPRELEELDRVRANLARAAAELVAVPNLEKVNSGNAFGDERLADAALAAVPKMAALRSVGVSGRITDAGVETLARNPGLRHVWLTDCPEITDAGIAHLARLPHLRALGVQYCKRVSAAGLRPFTTAPRLRELAFGGHDTAGEVLLDVARIPTLEALNMTTLGDERERLAGFPPAHLAALARLPRLRTISGYGAMMTDAGLAELARAPVLENVTALGPGVTDAGLSHLAGMPNLRRAEVGYSEAVTDAGLRRLAAAPRLETLRLFSAPRVTDAGLDALARTPALTGLSVGERVPVTEAALRRFVSARGRQLRELSLGDGRVGDDFVTFLVDTAPNLGTLHLVVCPRVTDRSIGPLATLREARIVNLDRSGLTPEGVVELRRRLGPGCEVSGPWRR